MSIAILTQLYDELRRVAISGSELGRGSSRLTKLIEPLESAGRHTPVMSTAAQYVRELVEGDAASSPQNLMRLSTLVTAALYTLGETGLAGSIEGLETNELGNATTHVGARMLVQTTTALSALKPDAWRFIHDAFHRGDFCDLRLLVPCLNTLDHYSTLTDYVADEVLPCYGKQIVPLLRTAFESKRNSYGQAKRLTLMYKLDPIGTRDLLQQVLEDGTSKELQIAATKCLGHAGGNLKLLYLKLSAKEKDVRRTALLTLLKLESDEAIEILIEGLAGANIELIYDELREHHNRKLLNFLLEQSQQAIDTVLSSQDPDTILRSAQRLKFLVICLYWRHDKGTEAFAIKNFARRDDLSQIHLGDVGQRIICGIADLLEDCSPRTQALLIESHALLGPEVLDTAFRAACKSLSPEEVFEHFSPYVKPVKARSRTASSANSAVIAEVLRQDSIHSSGTQVVPVKWDPRWLDIAVEAKDLELIKILGRPGHAGTNKLLVEVIETAFARSANLSQFEKILSTMARLKHPRATEYVIKTLSTLATPASKQLRGISDFQYLIVDLPHSAAAKLEKLLPTLHEKAIAALTGAITDLRLSK